MKTLVTGSRNCTVDTYPLVVVSQLEEDADVRVCHDCNIQEETGYKHNHGMRGRQMEEYCANLMKRKKIGSLFRKLLL